MCKPKLNFYYIILIHSTANQNRIIKPCRESSFMKSERQDGVQRSDIVVLALQNSSNFATSEAFEYQFYICRTWWGLRVSLIDFLDGLAIDYLNIYSGCEHLDKCRSANINYKMAKTLSAAYTYPEEILSQTCTSILSFHILNNYVPYLYYLNETFIIWLSFCWSDINSITHHQ